MNVDGVTAYLVEGLGLAILVALPVVGGAVLAGAAASALAGLIGIRDPAIPSIARALGAILTLTFVAAQWGEAALEFTQQSFDTMGALGRGEELAEP